MLTMLPTWAANLIVIIILVIVLSLPITYMIRKKMHGGHVGCDCGGSGKSLVKKYKKAKAHEAKEQAKKEESCCCCKDKEDK